MEPQKGLVHSLNNCVADIYNTCFFPLVYFEVYIESTDAKEHADIEVIARIRAFVDDFDDEGRPLVASGKVTDHIFLRKDEQGGLELKIKHRRLELKQIYQPGLLAKGSPPRFWSREEAKSLEETRQAHNDFRKYTRLRGWLRRGRGILMLIVAISALLASISAIPNLPQRRQLVLAVIGIVSSAIAILFNPLIAGLIPDPLQQKMWDVIGRS
ncbi:hypothetical protein BT69DRAFT_1276307 [Atractiella rhizophila]|nr:hypothetical protein BT69DRAFT_1276307 [Atractiella rhizophila]